MFAIKILYLQFFSDCSIKKKLSYENGSHHPFYHIPSTKNQREFFPMKKPLSVLKLLSVLSDRIFFRFLRVLRGSLKGSQC